MASTALDPNTGKDDLTKILKNDYSNLRQEIPRQYSTPSRGVPMSTLVSYFGIYSQTYLDSMIMRLTAFGTEELKLVNQLNNLGFNREEVIGVLKLYRRNDKITRLDNSGKKYVMLTDSVQHHDFDNFDSRALDLLELSLFNNKSINQANLMNHLANTDLDDISELNREFDRLYHHGYLFKFEVTKPTTRDYSPNQINQMFIPNTAQVSSPDKKF
ncbi:MAG: hypothetical protein IH840_02105, partial [Candidatus Heimdallarchaeota archaeon]|nr:hypothetical protein [Candidatus Heimdallarchaeota archaeon]